MCDPPAPPARRRAHTLPHSPRPQWPPLSPQLQIKLLHDKLKWCYFKEGVNHLENCKDLVEQLASKLRFPEPGTR